MAAINCTSASRDVLDTTRAAIASIAGGKSYPPYTQDSGTLTVPTAKILTSDYGAPQVCGLFSVFVMVMVVLVLVLVLVLLVVLVLLAPAGGQRWVVPMWMWMPVVPVET